jgi:hypothetical protein
MTGSGTLTGQFQTRICTWRVPNPPATCPMRADCQQRPWITDMYAGPRFCVRLAGATHWRETHDIGSATHVPPSTWMDAHLKFLLFWYSHHCTQYNPMSFIYLDRKPTMLYEHVSNPLQHIMLIQHWYFLGMTTGQIRIEWIENLTRGKIESDKKLHLHLHLRVKF